MLTTVALNKIETNQDMKYKHITYSSGAGKTFLDEAAFLAEDDLSDFEFGQAYTNRLTQIEMVSDPMIEQACTPQEDGVRQWVPGLGASLV